MWKLDESIGLWYRETRSSRYAILIPAWSAQEILTSYSVKIRHQILKHSLKSNQTSTVALILQKIQRSITNKLLRCTWIDSTKQWLSNGLKWLHTEWVDLNKNVLHLRTTIPVSMPIFIVVGECDLAAETDCHAEKGAPVIILHIWTNKSPKDRSRIKRRRYKSKPQRPESK